MEGTEKGIVTADVCLTFKEQERLACSKIFLENNEKIPEKLLTNVLYCGIIIKVKEIRTTI